MRLAHGLVAGRDWTEVALDDAMTEATRVLGMLRRYSGAVAAARSGAAVHGLWLIDPVGPVHLYRAAGWPRLKHDVRVDTVLLDATEICEVQGVPVTTLIRAAIDAAREADHREMVALMDSALKRGAPRSELLRLAPNQWIRAAIEFADIRSESALESVSRWEIHRAKLPAPELQVWFRDADGPFARTDFFWRSLRVVGEADGELKYDDDGVAKAAEAERQRRLEDLGLTVVRWGWREAVDEYGSFTSRLRQELRLAAERLGIPKLAI